MLSRRSLFAALLALPGIRMLAPKAPPLDEGWAVRAFGGDAASGKTYCHKTTVTGWYDFRSGEFHDVDKIEQGYLEVERRG